MPYRSDNFLTLFLYLPLMDYDTTADIAASWVCCISKKKLNHDIKLCLMNNPFSLDSSWTSSIFLNLFFYFYNSWFIIVFGICKKVENVRGCVHRHGCGWCYLTYYWFSCTKSKFDQGICFVFPNPWHSP